MLEPNSVTQLDFETRLDSEEGEIMGTKDLEKNGVKVWSHNICENEKHCWVHNTSNEPVLLKKEVVVARMREDTETLAVWRGYKLDSSDEAKDTEAGTTTDCFVSRDVVLEANSVSEVEFETEEDVEGGTLVGNSELAERGILVLRNSQRK